MYKARALASNLFPAADFPPTAQKPLTFKAFLAAATAFIHPFLLPLADLALDTYLPCLFLVIYFLVRPPTVLAFDPLKTIALANLPLATLLTLFLPLDLPLPPFLPLVVLDLDLLAVLPLPFPFPFPPFLPPFPL